MTKSREPADTPAYDQVPTPWVNSTDILAVDVPTFAFSPGRLRAVRATNARSGKPIVSIRCGGGSGGRQCRKVLGGIWATEFGAVLVVKALMGDTSLAKAHKANLRPAPEPDHFPMDELVNEHPILLADVRIATVWCPRHGEQDLDLAEVRRSVHRRRMTLKNQVHVTGSNERSTPHERSARPV